MENIKSANDVMKIALALEQNAYYAYKLESNKVANKLARETLEAIAEKELNHVEAIKEYSKTLSGKGGNVDKAIDAIKLQDKKAYIKSILGKLKNNLEASEKAGSGIKKIYEVAMKLEKDAYNLYKTFADASTDAKTKKFFDFLMKEENTHYEILQETLEYLEKPGEWFKEKERWIAEG